MMIVEGLLVLATIGLIKWMVGEEKENEKEYERTIMLKHYPSGYVEEEEL